MAGLSEGSKRTLVKEEDGHAHINVSLLEHLVMSSEVGSQQTKGVFKLCRAQFCSGGIFVYSFVFLLLFFFAHMKNIVSASL